MWQAGYKTHVREQTVQLKLPIEAQLINVSIFSDKSDVVAEDVSVTGTSKQREKLSEEGEILPEVSPRKSLLISMAGNMTPPEDAFNLPGFSCPSAPSAASHTQEGLQNQILGGCFPVPPVNPSVTVVFVHVGKDITHGKHLFFSVSQLRRTNPQASIAVVISKAVSEMKQVRSHLHCHGVEIVIAEELENSPATRRELEKFRNAFVVSGDMGIPGNPTDFNFRTSARMLYVLGFMKVSGRSKVFHVENDNLVFMDIARLAEVILGCGISMASGRRNHIEIALGFFFASTADPLQKLVDFWIRQYQSGKTAMQNEVRKHFGVANHEWLNDMSLSALYHAYYPDQLSILPSSSVNKDLKTQCVFDQLQFIFDTGNLAMWHFGDFQDAKPHTNQHGWGAYKDFDPRPWNISWCRQGRCTSPFLHKADGSRISVGHLHVHSKRLPLHMSSCVVPRVGWKELQSATFAASILKSLEFHTEMLGNINLIERLGAPGRHRDGTSWQLDGRDRRPSYPFITGDGFRGACTWHCGDYASDGEHQCNIKSEYVQYGDCVFIEMTDFKSGKGTDQYMKNFFDLILPKLDQKVVVVTHNGDMSAPGCDGFWRKSEPQSWPQYDFEEHLNSPKILHWFAVNCFWKSPATRPRPSKLTCIPIGIENRYNSVGKDPVRYVERLHEEKNTSMERKLVMTDVFELSGIKPEREHLKRFVLQKDYVTQVPRKSWNQWASAVQNHNFVFCPWGHGLDTHRTWEVLLLGSFPVVRNSTLDSLYVGLPVLVVSSW
eukprot:CAMPEP_0174932404 /NCGR_PEP_ID=MMETSP1355-20121228/35681_1 /TAXON_ID=464990 /ORGANISM="Hemiselmis tepida, Strain CCMP443" /LENGTH=774 /DNA_ID=CAMNT_0016178813 /DNA_START=153 /DNA_END=2474 /DNA_ORIENTATION=+